MPAMEMKLHKRAVPILGLQHGERATLWGLKSGDSLPAHRPTSFPFSFLPSTNFLNYLGEMRHLPVPRLKQALMALMRKASWPYVVSATEK